MKPRRCTGGQKTEDEAWKAYWKTLDGRRSLEGALEDRRRRTKLGICTGGQKMEDKASLEFSLESRRQSLKPAGKAHLRIGYWRRNSVRRIGLQEIEDEASKAHWRTGDGGQIKL